MTLTVERMKAFRLIKYFLNKIRTHLKFTVKVELLMKFVKMAVYNHLVYKSNVLPQYEQGPRVNKNKNIN